MKGDGCQRLSPLCFELEKVYKNAIPKSGLAVPSNR